MVHGQGWASCGWLMLTFSGLIAELGSTMTFAIGFREVNTLSLSSPRQ